ncbi:hypothetical protein ACI65C_003530 [Semiaphis heraclei]
MYNKSTSVCQKRMRRNGGWLKWRKLHLLSSSPQDRNLPDTSKKKKNTRTSSAALTPPYTSKNRFAPLLTLQVNGNTDGTADEVSTQES